MKTMSERRAYTVHGVTRYLSKEEVEAILASHIPKKSSLFLERFEVAKRPTDGKCFKVELEKIDTNLFVKKRENKKQEETRILILEAIRKASMEPEKYKLFYLLVPEKEWVYGAKGWITIERAMEYAEEVGGYTTTLVEEALGWGQQITNDAGLDKVWKVVCNFPDTLKCPRLCIYEKATVKHVGGSSTLKLRAAASSVGSLDYNACDSVFREKVAVPSVVIKSLH